MGKNLYGPLEKLSRHLEDLLDEVSELDDDTVITPDEFAETIREIYDKVNRILNN